MQLHLVIAATLLATAYGQSAPTFFVLQPGSSESNPQKITPAAGQSYAVSIGSNVTLGCQYTDPAWSTTIGKWSSTNSQLFPLITNGFVLPDFADLLVRYPALGLRVSGVAFYSANPIIVYLRLTNVQQMDMGQYGCYSTFSKTSLTANITLVLNQTNLYGVRAISTDQQMVVVQNSSTTAYTCSVYRSAGSVPDYILWFDKCKWSGLGQDIGNAARTISCSNNPSIYNSVSKTQIANGVGVIGSPNGTETIVVDAYPMPAGQYFGSTFWQRNLIRDWFSLSLTWQTIYGTPVGSPSGWLNQSLGCFAFRNATNAFFRDYMTFVQPGVDLDLDPTQFSCGRHHFVQPQGSVAPLFCTVLEPIYRSAGTYTWEIWTASSPNGPYTTYQYASQVDVNNRGIGKNVLFIAPVSSVVNASLNLQQNQTKTGLNVTVDTATTVNWRYRLVVTYSDGSTSRSEFFSIATSFANGTSGSVPQPPPKQGAVQNKGAAIVGSSLVFSLVSGLALLCLLFNA